MGRVCSSLRTTRQFLHGSSELSCPVRPSGSKAGSPAYDPIHAHAIALAGRAGTQLSLWQQPAGAGTHNTAQAGRQTWQDAGWHARAFPFLATIVVAHCRRRSLPSLSP